MKRSARGHDERRSCHHLKEANGTLWIGTTGGLLQWKEGRFTRAQGLFADIILQVLPDGRGNLWMGSNKGIFRVSQAEREAVAKGRIARFVSRFHGRAEGCTPRSATAWGGPSGLRTRDGRLWFPTIRVAVASPTSTT